LEYVGRRDEQVKVRGNRVEVGEVEAVLNGHEEVKEAVVVAREEAGGEKRLVAYVVSERQDLLLAASELRRYMKERLPEYMIPSAFVMLEELPLTPSGKVDRRALPAPDQNNTGSENVYVAPRTPVEKLLASMWEEVLGVTRVGINDNFFELGGHSLRATQVVTHARELFQVELPLRSLFERPTIADVAEALLHNPEERDRIERTARLLVKVNQLSDEEVELMLTEKLV